jgi:homoserine kinase
VRFTARVPATSANVGPGFDSFGLALDLCNEFTVDTDRAPGVSWEGEGADELPTDGSDRVSQAMRFVARSLIDERGAALDLPPLSLHGFNRIPLDRGLGSSAAASVAGVVLAHHLLGLGVPNQQAIFSSAAELEGHPDNAGPAVYGGFTVALPKRKVHRFDPHPDLRPVLLIPQVVRLSTAAARAALPPEVPMRAAVSNIAHGAITLVALTSRPELLREALVDRIHQPYRLPLVPKVREVFDDLVGEGVAVCVSGAGPTLLAFDLPGRSVPDPGDGWRVLRPPVRATGFEVVQER